MALGMTTAAANAALDALLATYRWVKLHVGDPGAAMTANPATETTRKQATFPAAASASAANSGALLWTAIAGTQDATHFTLWDASTAGNPGISGLITANGYTAGDDYTVAIGALTVVFPIAS